MHARHRCSVVCARNLICISNLASYIIRLAVYSTQLLARIVFIHFSKILLSRALVFIFAFVFVRLCPRARSGDYFSFHYRFFRQHPFCDRVCPPLFLFVPVFLSPITTIETLAFPLDRALFVCRPTCPYLGGGKCGRYAHDNCHRVPLPACPRSRSV